MSDNQIINAIRSQRNLTRLFNKMTVEQKRRLMAELDGDVWHLEQIMEEILEDKDNG